MSFVACKIRAKWWPFKCTGGIDGLLPHDYHPLTTVSCIFVQYPRSSNQKAKQTSNFWTAVVPWARAGKTMQKNANSKFQIPSSHLLRRKLRMEVRVMKHTPTSTMPLSIRNRRDVNTSGVNPVFKNKYPAFTKTHKNRKTLCSHWYSHTNIFGLHVYVAANPPCNGILVLRLHV